MKPALVRRMLNNLVRSRMGALVALFLRETGLAPLAVRILNSSKKETIELAYQVEWAREFQNNRSKVLEHWRRYREFDQALTLCSISDDSRILDVGCGISTVLHFLPGERHGVDPLADQYKKLYNYPTGISVQKAFGEDLPFPDEYFDVVFCSNVLDHVMDPQNVMQEIRRVLQPDGHLVLTVEVKQEKQARDPAHPHCFTEQDVRSLLEDAFKIVHERESPWIEIRNYLKESDKTYGTELVVISRKL